MPKKTIVIYASAMIAMLVGVTFFLSSSQKPGPTKASYLAAQTDRPIAETPETIFDFGEIKVSDVKQNDFVLKNTGTKPLQILNINSSCNCTFGQFIYDNKESGKFGMHDQSGYLGDISPNASATIRVIYQPSLMPVYGVVEREVFVTTNDPAKEKLVFAVKANVK